MKQISAEVKLISGGGDAVKILGKDLVSRKIVWEEPNRGNEPPLFIAQKGVRHPTLTGVSWINDRMFVVNNRCGLRVALFDLENGDNPVCVGEIPIPTDAIAVRPVSKTKWEVLMSGCWSSIYSVFELEIDEQASRLTFLYNRPHVDRTFSHGVGVSPKGEICVALHAGKDPRIIIGNEISRLPPPWGARDVCFDEKLQKSYAVAVSAPARRVSYKQTSTSIWARDYSEKNWRPLAAIDNVHSDSCKMHGERLWLADQMGDRIIAFNLRTNHVEMVVEGRELDYPHTLSISEAGLLAVANYGNSAVVVFDIKDL